MAQNYDIECFRIVGLLHVNRIKVKPDDLTSKIWSFCSAFKNLGAHHPLGAKICSSEKCTLGGYDSIEISKVTGPNFTVLVSPNAGQIAIDGMTIRF